MTVPYLFDRVWETTTTTGTGTISLGGAVSSDYQTFAAVLSSTQECYYVIELLGSGEWEVGIGTFTAGSPNTLARTTVLASSNGGSLVSFGAGTKNVWMDAPAAITSAVAVDSSGLVTITSSGNLKIVLGDQPLYNFYFTTGGLEIPEDWSLSFVGPYTNTLTPTAVGCLQFSGQPNGQALNLQSVSELTTISTGASTNTTLSIPAGAVVLGVSVLVVTAIPTATTFTVTGATSGTTFDTAAVSTSLGSSDSGTAAGAYYNASAQYVKITPNTGPGTNTGQVRVTVHYWTITPPTS